MNQVAELERNPVAIVRGQLEQMGEQFARALPAHIPLERFKRVLMTGIQNNRDLITADRGSLWNASMRAAQDGLLPDGREAALVIYGKAVQYMPMIAGLRKKVRNSGEIATWEVQVVHQRDEFEFELGDAPFIKHKPCLDGDPGPVIAAYSVATLKSGEKSREVMTKAQIDKVRQSSRARDKGPWVDWYEEMCRKTVARRHAKVLPMSTDLDDLLRQDDELYDFAGAKAEDAPPRPKLQDFMRETKEDFVATKREAEQHIAEELEQPQPDESPMPEFSAADAYELGREHRRQNIALKAPPGGWRDGSSEHEAWIGAREEGWRAEDKEIAEREKAAKKA